MITSLTDLTSAAQARATQLLDSATAAVPSGLRAEVRDEFTIHLCERLDPASTPAEVEAVFTDLGPITAETPGAGPWRRLAAGLRLRGIGRRIAGTWWNPADERLFLPRVFGWGWDLNYGALAVRLGLIEPDAEAVPFTATPDRAFQAAAVVPVALAAATVAHYAVRGRSLPDPLPAHWNAAGVPDRWTPKRRAAALDLGLTGVAAVAATSAAFSARPGPSRAGTLAAATMGGMLGATTTVLRSLSRPRRWASAGLLAATIVPAGAVLTCLARAGRRAEIQHDLANEAADV